MASSTKSTIDSLQVGRGIAAIAVVCVHVETYVTQQIGALPAILSRIFSFGYLGVDFFFVLSGFIIYYTNHESSKEEGWARKYAESRLTRIYVPYLPVGIAMGAVYSLLPQLSRGEHEWNWFSTLTLLPSGADPSLHIAWTLQHEIIFYALAFVFLRWGLVLAGSLIWAAVILVLLPFHFTLEPAISPIDLEFMFGIGCAWCYLNVRPRAGPALAAIGATLILAFFMIGSRDWSVVFGLGLTFLLLPIVWAEREGRFSFTKVLTLLGSASYAIYLVHLPVLSVTVRLLGGLDPLIGAVICVVVAILIGILYHLFFEKPALSLMRRVLRSRTRAS